MAKFRTRRDKLFKKILHHYKGGDDAAQSRPAGEIVKLSETKTIADGLQAILCELTWPVVIDLVDDIIVAEDGDITEATKQCYEILKVAVEPRGAISLAAVQSHSFRSSPAWMVCKHIGIMISGGNLDLSVLWDSLIMANHNVQCYSFPANDICR